MSITAALIIAVLALSAMCLILLYCFMRSVNRVIWLQEDLQFAADQEHAKCMGAVMAYVGNQWAAQVLDIAAADYASVESQGDRDRIGRLLWRQDGDPIPSIWMRERADRLRVESDWGIDPVADAARININEVIL